MVVLVRFPFTDLEGSKQRPAVVLSTEAYHRAGVDVVLAAITGRDVETPGRFDHVLADWRTPGLLHPSIVRAGKLATLDRSMIRRTLGSLEDSDLLEVDLKVRSALGIDAR